MSHFKIVVEVPRGKLEQFMRAAVGPWSIEIGDYVEDQAAEVTNGAPKPRRKAKGKKNRRGNPHIKLTMTGKKPTEGTKIEVPLEMFEKFEAQLGIGDVSAQDFKNHLDAKGIGGSGMLSRLITEGFLNYL